MTHATVGHRDDCVVIRFEGHPAIKRHKNCRRSSSCSPKRQVAGRSECEALRFQHLSPVIPPVAVLRFAERLAACCHTHRKPVLRGRFRLIGPQRRNRRLEGSDGRSGATAGYDLRGPGMDCISEVVPDAEKLPERDQCVIGGIVVLKRLLRPDTPNGD
jgi:hypothetical protein